MGLTLARYLLNVGYKIYGTTRDSQICDTSRLRRLGVQNDIKLLSLAE